MRNIQADESRPDTRSRETRHDLLSLTGGALVGLGLVLGPSGNMLAWVPLLLGIGVAIIGAVWSARVALDNARSHCTETIVTIPTDTHDSMH